MPFIKHTPPPKPCLSPEHNPPGMIVLPPGEHLYRCPSCGTETTIYVPQVTC